MIGAETVSTVDSRLAVPGGAGPVSDAGTKTLVAHAKELQRFLTQPRKPGRSGGHRSPPLLFKRLSFRIGRFAPTGATVLKDQEPPRSIGAGVHEGDAGGGGTDQEGMKCGFGCLPLRLSRSG